METGREGVRGKKGGRRAPETSETVAFRHPLTLYHSSAFLVFHAAEDQLYGR